MPKHATGLGDGRTAHGVAVAGPGGWGTGAEDEAGSTPHRGCSRLHNLNTPRHRSTLTAW